MAQSPSGRGTGAWAQSPEASAPTPSRFWALRRRRAISPTAGSAGSGDATADDPTYTAPSQDQFDREIVQWMPLSQVSRMKPGEGEELILPLPEGYRPDRDMYPKREYPSTAGPW